ncbi:MAG TPA: YeeE/YedE family protein [Roseiarcus sp.]|jgi:uncharacterized membrane protein YedE/YeeE
MTIDWSHFTPLSALAGGVLIGLAAAWLILANGRILGAAGVLGGLAPPRAGDWAWRLALLAGLVAAPLVAQPLLHAAPPAIEADTATLIVGGLMVGFGTRLANGCTSGHGVCGLARVSPRSLAATATFMATGFLTVFVVRHLIA